METLAAILIIMLLGVEVYCGVAFYYYCKWLSAKKTAARRAASRPKIYKAVRDSWTIERNRRSLWDLIEK